MQSATVQETKEISTRFERCQELQSTNFLINELRKKVIQLKKDGEKH